MRIGSALPPLDGATEWVNSGPVGSADLAGRPLLVHFWALSCHSCHEMMPTVVAWHQRHASRGLQVISVHQARCEADTDVAAIKQAIEKCGITHPVAIDNDFRIVDAWENKFVPSFYLFNADGKLVHYQAGDRGQKMIEQAIERVLGAAASANA
ncbi:MAG: redoxin domain-containing protein [Armatimonadetes bacterium]|nr:redoxin domain-containing protein [Armatimonadota bacterium]